MSILRDDLDVMRVGRQGFVLHERTADLFGRCAISGIHLLLIRGCRAFGGVTLVSFGIVRSRLLILLHGTSQNRTGEKRRRSHEPQVLFESHLSLLFDSVSTTDQIRSGWEEKSQFLLTTAESGAPYGEAGRREQLSL